MFLLLLKQTVQTRFLLTVSFHFSLSMVHLRPLSLPQSPESTDNSVVKVLHWGGAKKPSHFPSTERLVELGAQQILPSDGQCLVLTSQGTLYSLVGKGSEDFTETVSECLVVVTGRKQIWYHIFEANVYT